MSVMIQVRLNTDTKYAKIMEYVSTMK